MTGNGSLIQAIVGDIMRNIPVGFAHHKTEMPCYTLDVAFEEMDRYEEDAELWANWRRIFSDRDAGEEEIILSSFRKMITDTLR